MSIPRILVLCTGNSCRSQMAEGWLRHFSHGQAEVHSAGVLASRVNPRAIQVMAEAGVDISRHTSKHVDTLLDMSFDWVITVCDNAKEQCPFIAGATRTLHHAFHDPTFTVGSEEEILADFRRVRDEIREFCEVFLREHASR